MINYFHRSMVIGLALIGAAALLIPTACDRVTRMSVDGTTTRGDELASASANERRDFTEVTPSVAQSTSSVSAVGGPELAENELSGDERFNVGDVVEGDLASHTFSFVNRSGRELSIAPENGIVKRCGCTELHVERDRLPPDERTDVRVDVDTRDRVGAISHGGTVLWLTPDGEEHPASFTLAATVRQSLEASPAIVRFSATDVSGGETKVIALASSEAVDWESITAACSEGPFELVGSSARADGALLKLRCAKTALSRSTIGKLLVTVKRSGPGRNASPTATLSVPIRAESTANIAISPETVSIRFSANGSVGKGRLLLQSESSDLSSARLVQSIEAEGFAVEWSLAPSSGANSAFLDLSMTPVDRSSPRRGTLGVATTDGGRAEVTFVLVGFPR